MLLASLATGLRYPNLGANHGIDVIQYRQIRLWQGTRQIVRFI